MPEMSSGFWYLGRGGSVTGMGTLQDAGEANKVLSQVSKKQTHKRL
jgi:hypothetical protein